MPVIRLEFSLIWVIVFPILLILIGVLIGVVVSKRRRSDASDQAQPTGDERSDLAFEIMSIVSHRLKTVGEVVRGHLRRLEEDELPSDLERWRVARRAIWEEATEIPSLTDRIDVVVRLAVAGQPLVMEPVNLAAMIETLMLEISPAADEKGIILGGVLTQNSDGEAIVSGDTTALKVAISNLLENAIRHTPSGTEVTAAITRNKDAVHLEIADTGPGIPPEQLERIFDRGARIYRPRQSGGSGMGLYLTKLLVELHGGQIEVESIKGTKFMIILPVRRVISSSV
jgi:signal transduction histidine kinase